MSSVTAPFTGAKVATDLLGDINFQKMKMTFGVDGVATDVSSVNPFPVTSIISGAGLTALQNVDASTAAVRPAGGAFAIAPSDAIVFGTATRSIYVGVTGNVATVVGGVTVLFTAVPAGSVLPIVATKVLATGTTASAMVGLT